MTEPTSCMERRHFRGVNALRFVAAFCVILYHCTPEVRSKNLNAFGTIFHNLMFGVDFFFIISGFLITYLLIVEKNNFGKIYLKKFYLRRILRIFPLYYLIVIYTYWVFKASHPHIDYASHFVFLGNFSLISHKGWSLTSLNPLWSICIEEHFYLIIPILVSLLPLRFLKYLFLVIICISIGFRTYMAYYFKYDNWMVIYAHTISRCDVIALGGLIAVLYCNRGDKLKLNRWIMYASLICLFVAVMTFNFTDFNSIIRASVYKYMMVIPMAVFFISYLFPSKPSVLLQYVKNSTVLDYLGKISFGLYMYHSLVLYYISGQDYIYDNVYIRVIVITIITIILSSLSYELYEKIFLRLKKKYVV
jgi:peptidoglycan/LPS O-acetylase OafA/YrhL